MTDKEYPKLIGTVVQITGANEKLYALCADGEIWEFTPGLRGWKKIPQGIYYLPGTEGRKKHDCQIPE